MSKPAPIKKVLTLEEAQKVRWFNAAKTKASEAEKRKKDLEDEIREFLGDATVAVDDKGNTLIKVVPHPGQNRADLGILEHLFPEAFAASIKRSPYTYLK